MAIVAYQILKYAVIEIQFGAKNILNADCF